MPDLHVFPDLDALSEAAAEYVAAALADAVAARGAAAFVLTGGSTPAPLYRRLAEDHAGALDWGRVHVFWGDERCVPLDHAESNYRMAREAMLDALPIPEAQVHPMRCASSPDDAARTYEDTLRAFFEGRERLFDVTLLGMGADGHIASLFPGSPVLDAPGGWVAHTEAPPSSPIRDRLTLTLPALNASRQVLFLVSGAAKREAVRRALAPAEAEPLPAARVRPDGALAWFLDEAAYGRTG